MVTYNLLPILYPKLAIYRVIHIMYIPSIWWTITKSLPFLKKPCTTMLRLLCGCNILAVNIKTNVERNVRLCCVCTLGQVEDLMHFIMSCPVFDDMRTELLSRIESNLSLEGKASWLELSKYMKCLLLLGLDFPLSKEDMFCIRYFSCISVNNMYVRRRALEPP